MQGNCEKDQSKECGKLGLIYDSTDNQCVDPPNNRCPPNTVLVSGACLPISQSNNNGPEIIDIPPVGPGSSDPNTSPTPNSTPSPDGGSREVSINPAGLVQVITRDSGGNVVDTSTQSTQDFCAQNPQSRFCAQTSASGGASCSSPPVCQGDAIECAILQQTYQNKCQSKQIYDLLNADQDDPPDLSLQSNIAGDYKAELSIQTNADLLDKVVERKDLGQTFQDNIKDYFGIGERQCLPDIQFDVLGKTITISTAILCNIGVFIKLVLHIFAYFRGIPLIVRSVTG